MSCPNTQYFQIKSPFLIESLRNKEKTDDHPHVHGNIKGKMTYVYTVTYKIDKEENSKFKKNDKWTKKYITVI